MEKLKKLDQETLDQVKKQGYWKEGDTTYMIEEFEYPHDERCENSMCWCLTRAKKENPEKCKRWLEKIKQLKK